MRNDPLEKKRAIQTALGKDAKEPWCAVLTQIGEMSLNISAPQMVTDACPPDRMAQRKGRHGRFSPEGREDLLVVIPHKNGALYPAPYGAPPVPGRPLWEANPAFSRFLGHLQTRPGLQLTPRYWVEAINRCVQPGDAERGVTNRRQFLREISAHWAFLPADQTEHEDRTQSFKTREIGPQITVYLEIDFRRDALSNVRMGSAELQLYKQINALSVPYYRAEALSKAGKLERVTVMTSERDRPEELLILRRGFYHPEVGLTEGE